MRMRSDHAAVAGSRAPVRAVRVVRGWGHSAYAAVTRSGSERTEALLLLKAAVATVLAWQLAVHLMDSPTPFYAPMAALLVVDRTIVRSVGASAQRVAAVIVGMSIAWLVGSLVGVTAWSMLGVMFLAMLIGRWHRLGDHGIQVPTMVLLSLVTVQGTDTDFTVATILQTALGGIVGVATNAVVLAPMHVEGPRRALRSLTESVEDILSDMSAGLRDGWDGPRARRWYEAATAIGVRAADVLRAVETGRESTRFNVRHRLRPVRVDWDGYVETVDAVRRVQWQLAGIARTLVDAADEAASQPSPSPDWLEHYALVLDDIREALGQFGVWSTDAERAVESHTGRALDALEDLSERVRRTPLDDPHAWPAYGALVLDARRLAGELRARNPVASVPTDTGPLRPPVAEVIPVVAQLRDQVPGMEQIPRIIGQVSRSEPGREPDDDPGGAPPRS